MNSRKRRLTRLALIAIAMPAAAFSALAIAGGRSMCWMTGGGSVFTASGSTVEYAGAFDQNGRVTHGFELRCEGRPNNLEINWDGNRFHLTNLTSAVCLDDPNIEPDPPGATFDTYVGSGSGRLNGDLGYCANWIFTDAGEPGVPDTATIEILRCTTGEVMMQVSGPLTFGNHQAHSQ
jgi:hypothetical protein